jgi:putative ABC transport system permease protein
LRFWPFLLRELGKHRRFAALFVLILGLGLSGFLLVEALRASVARSVEANSRAILSADLAVTLRRPFTKEETEKLEGLLRGLPFTRTVEFFAMLGKGGEARLVLLRGVGSEYPLFGSLEPTQPSSEKAGLRLEKEGAALLASPEALEQIDARVGDALQIGDASFRLLDSIREDPTQSFRNFALGGRAYVHLDQLARTNLLQHGSTATYAFLALTGSEAATEQLRARIRAAFPAPEWRVTTAKEAGESSLRALSYLGDFLGLVSLVALLLSSLGAAYLYRSYLEKRKPEIAIYRALGLPLPWLQAQAATQTALLALLSLLPALFLAWALLPALEGLIHQWSQSAIELRLHPESLLPLLLLSVLGTPLLLLPELLVLRRFTPLGLFRDQESESMRRPWAHYLPALLLFAGLAPITARSFRTAGVFLGLLAGLVLLLFLVFFLFSKLLSLDHGRWTTRHAFLLLSRRRRSAATVFLTLALGSLLIHLLPQLEASLRAELETPSRLPSFFLFDIQPEQKDPLEATVRQTGHSLSGISPLVRARITAINGQSYQRDEDSASFRTREDEQSSQVRSRGVNLSFRQSLQESETLVRGRPFAPVWNEKDVPEISIETRFAERLKVKIGDVLRFDVQGNEIEGRIVNERRVRWTSFQPNFFLIFQDGVLNDAPLSYLANLGAMPKPEKLKLQRMLAKAFPNVSVIDVAATVERALDLLGKMRLSLLLLAALALTAGLSVLTSVLSLEARDRARSLVLYRALGAKESDLRRILLTESFMLTTVAVALGALGSVLFTFGLATFLFDGAFRVAYAPLVGFSLLLAAAGMLLSWLASRGMVKKAPLDLLRSVE